MKQEKTMSHKRSQETSTGTGQHTPLDADERSVLSRLLHTPLLRVEDLHISTGLSRATLYRLLARMQQHKWVEALSVPGLGVRSCSCYYLSTQGIARLAHEQGDDPVHLAGHWGATEQALLRLLPRVPQRIALQEILWELCLSAPDHLTSQGQRSAIAWHVVHDSTYHIPENEQQGSRCRVSALVFLRQRPEVAHYPDALREEAAQQQAREAEAWYALQFLQDSPHLSMSALEKWLARPMVACAHAPWFPPIVVLLADRQREALWHACM
jgi:DNA-binding PadR family transcriptional regulator